MATPVELGSLRDVGGAPVVGGGHVRRGVLYRCGRPHVLDPPACRAMTAELGLRSVVDLRSELEIERAGRFATVDGGPRLEHVPILDGSAVDRSPVDSRALASRYAHMSFMAGGRIGRVIRHVSCAENLPTMIFCTAGRDRTDVVVALVLAVLGVADEHIVADQAVSEAPPEVMARLLGSIRSRHGSVASYVASIGVDEAATARLRRSLVER